MRSIVLCGFMGCGKTRIGKLLSEKTGFRFIDTDDYVKEMAGVSIHDMLIEGRIEDVRKFEHDAVLALSRLSDAVIATGGGVLIKDENGRAFHENAYIVYLMRDFNTVYPVISEDPVRVIAYRKSFEELKKLHDDRIPLYEKYADLRINNDGTADDAAEEILRNYHKIKL